MSAGKGDKPRPTDKKVYDMNYDNIAWKSKDVNQAITKKKGKSTFVYKSK